MDSVLWSLIKTRVGEIGFMTHLITDLLMDKSQKGVTLKKNRLKLCETKTELLSFYQEGC